MKERLIAEEAALGTPWIKVVAPSGQLRKNKKQLAKIAFHIFDQLQIISRSCLGNTVDRGCGSKRLAPKK
ncbi:hypothetical protein [Enterococcus thailandicus]|uniref:Uncharacterized protein n=1 Tax=Enterococcus thailandicus TaxID=417368 RepID=A0A179EQ18_ENTTH|nr:hypothetical protein [Enterococcus thailandicus]OAQ54923.1 hypothetical protein A6E74_11160 [Enterococcus thailandicus]